MFYVFSLKKLRVISLTVLLFALITAIIVGGSYRWGSVAVSGRKTLPEPVLIIDPGHGGLDGGAVGVDGTVEAAINLELSLRLYDLSRFFGVRAAITRDSEEIDYPEDITGTAKKKAWDQKTRVDFINSFDNAVLISIHQNKFPDPRPWGPQVLYGNGEASEMFGKAVHEAVNAQLSPENRRVASKISDKIYLMRSVKCPAILVECGFVSNSGELGKLKNEDYQKEFALILAASYLRFGF